MRVPIACTLTPDAASDRIDEWQRFIAGAQGPVERTGRRELRISLEPDERTLEAAVELTQREKTCCSFFDFSFRETPGALVLVVQVPPDAVENLDRFAALIAGTA